MRKLLAVIIASGMLIAGCGGDSPQQPPPSTPTPQTSNWPETLTDFRFRWSAEPGIDIATGNAVPLRAYLESWLVISYTDDVDSAYPGYLRATPEPVPVGSAAYNHLPMQQRTIRAFLGGVDPGDRILGNEDLHILRIEPLDTGFRAFVCDATYRVYRQSSGSTSLDPLRRKSVTGPSEADSRNMVVRRIEFSDRDPRSGSTPPAAPVQPQQGPLPAPRTDVFGPWFITGAGAVEFWWSADHPGVPEGFPEATRFRDEARAAEDDMRRQCLDRYPADAAERAKLATTVIETPPSVEPAVPGWPAEDR
jgi:hypothetical protein